MGSSMYLNRKLIPKRPRADVICEFTGMISSLGIQFEYENEHTLYLWKHSRPNGIRVYVVIQQSQLITPNHSAGIIVKCFLIRSIMMRIA